VDRKRQWQQQELQEEENPHGEPPSAEQVVSSAYSPPGDQRLTGTCSTPRSVEDGLRMIVQPASHFILCHEARIGV
jgi:hypothetical protein